MFWGSTWICKVQLDAGTTYGGFDKKRRRDIKHGPPPPPAHGEGEAGENAANNNFKVVTTYRPILFADFVAPGEMVVVERPLVDVLARLPPAYFKPKYGAS